MREPTCCFATWRPRTAPPSMPSSSSSHLAYYGDPRVHSRVGWRGGPLQPEGFLLAPFNPEILQAIRQRKPFWRQT